jgi:hypothetical protein
MNRITGFLFSITVLLQGANFRLPDFNFRNHTLKNIYRNQTHQMNKINIFYIFTQFKFHYYCKPASLKIDFGWDNFLN